MSRILAKGKSDVLGDGLSEVTRVFIGNEDKQPVEAKNVIRTLSLAAGGNYELFWHKNSLCARLEARGYNNISGLMQNVAEDIKGGSLKQIAICETSDSDIFWNEVAAPDLCRKNITSGMRGSATILPHKFEAHVDLYDGSIFLNVRMDEDSSNAKSIQLTYDFPATAIDLQCCKVQWWSYRQTFAVFVGNKFYEVKANLTNEVFVSLSVLQSHTFSGEQMSWGEVRVYSNSIRFIFTGTSRRFVFCQIAANPTVLQINKTENFSYDYNFAQNIKSYIFIDDTRIKLFDAASSLTEAHLTLKFSDAGATTSFPWFTKIPAYMSATYGLTKFRKIATTINMNRHQTGVARIMLIVDNSDPNYEANKNKIFEVVVNLNSAQRNIVYVRFYDASSIVANNGALINVFPIETSLEKHWNKNNEYLFTDYGILIANNYAKCLLFFDLVNGTLEDVTQRCINESGLYNGLKTTPIPPTLTKISLGYSSIGSCVRGNF